MSINYKYPPNISFSISEGLTTNDRKVDSDWWKYFIEGKGKVICLKQWK